jgi:hypothetical protein
MLVGEMPAGLKSCAAVTRIPTLISPPSPKPTMAFHRFTPMSRGPHFSSTAPLE